MTGSNQGIYGCDACRTTLGRAGCPVHRDPNDPVRYSYTDAAGSYHYTGSGLVMTHCLHGLDLRLNPRCYLCRPKRACDFDCDACREDPDA